MIHVIIVFLILIFLGFMLVSIGGGFDGDDNGGDNGSSL